MFGNIKTEKLFNFLMIILFLLIYLFFPNNNLSVDSFSYGASVKYGDELFSAHHLLYNYFNYLIYKFVSFFFENIDALRLMQFINALIALMCLLVLNRIIIKQKNDKNQANILTFFVGSCFGIMRFAVDAESYLFSIFFSLLASFFYFNFLKSEKRFNILLSSVFISIACLFHQVHLLWGIGLFFGFLLTKNIKNVLLFSVPTLLVPFVYALVLVFYYQITFSVPNLIKFIGEYYFSDSANTSLGLINFLVTPITFFRTFFQVHGIIIDVLKLMPVVYGVIPVVFFLIFLFIYKFFKSVKLKRTKIRLFPFEYTHLIIFALQFAFAFYSHGNSEFMVMLPFALTLFIYLIIDFDLKAVKYITIAMLIWNFFFAIYPNNKFDYQNNGALIAIIRDNPDKIFILKEKNIVANQYYYETGCKEYHRLLDNQKKEVLAELNKQHKIFYTDALSKRVPFNRTNVTEPTEYNNLILVRHIKTIKSDLGSFSVDEVILRD